MQEILLEVGEGTLEGYVVDASEPNIANYLRKFTNLGDPLVQVLRGQRECVALLRNLQVPEEQRGIGTGTALVANFMEEAEALGATAYVLISDTDESQLDGFDLRQWYEKLGFTSTVLNTGSGPVMVCPPDLAETINKAYGGIDPSVEPGADEEFLF